MELEGVIYMPTQVVELGGNGDINVNSKMWIMVADSFDFAGSGTFRVKPDNNGADLPDIAPTVIAPSMLTN